jgi:hypothetical protein
MSKYVHIRYQILGHIRSLLIQINFLLIFSSILSVSSWISHITKPFFEVLVWIKERNWLCLVMNNHNYRSICGRISIREFGRKRLGTFVVGTSLLPSAIYVLCVCVSACVHKRICVHVHMFLMTLN